MFIEIKCGAEVLPELEKVLYGFDFVIVVPQGQPSHELRATGSP